MPNGSAKQLEAKLATCNVCKKSFAHKNSLRQHRHQSKHASERIDESPSIQRPIADEVDHPTEDNTKKKAKVHKCWPCNKVLRTKGGLKQHKRDKHAVTTAEPAYDSAEDVSVDSQKKQDTKQEAAESENTEDKTSNQENENATDSDPPLLECEDCGDEFYDFDALYKHLEYFCRTPWAKWMRMLMGKAAPERLAHMYKCNFCPQVFHTFTSFDQHQEFLSHGPYWDGSKRKKPLKKRYEGQTAANWHEHDVTLAYKCNACEETFRTMEWFTDHMWYKHSCVLRHPNDHLEKQDTPKVPEKTVKSGYRCTPCDEPFDSEDLLARHWESAHAETWLSLFDDNNKAKPKDKKGKVPCITCWRTFGRSSKMMLHVETGKCHTYLDTDSIKSAIKNSDQTVVSRFYTSEGKFQCPHCDHTSLALSGLLLHAQSQQCSLSISGNPLMNFISEVRWRMIEVLF